MQTSAERALEIVSLSELGYLRYQNPIKSLYFSSFLMLNANRALSPTRWCYQSTVKVVAFLNNDIFYKERRALAFNRDRCCHLALCLRLILFHFCHKMSQDVFTNFLRPALMKVLKIELCILDTNAGKQQNKLPQIPN